MSQLVDEALFSNYAALTGYRVAHVGLSSASAAISRICNTYNVVNETFFEDTHSDKIG